MVRRMWKRRTGEEGLNKLWLLVWNIKGMEVFLNW